MNYRTLLTVVAVITGVWILNVLVGGIFMRIFLAEREQAARLFEGISRAQEIEYRVKEYFSSTGELPDSNQQIGVGPPDGYSVGGVHSIGVETGGVLRLRFKEDVVDGGAILLRPRINYTGTGSTLVWECFGLGIDAEVLAMIPERACSALSADAALPPLAEPDATVDALIAAIVNRRESVVRRLVAQGVNVNDPTRVGESPLFAAVEQGDSVTIEILLKAGADVNQVSSFDGYTPLIFSIHHGDRTNVVRLLFEAGADIEQRDTKGRTVLMHAAQSGNINTVSLLLKSGADVNAMDNSGNKAVNHAMAQGSDSSVYRMLWEKEIEVKQGGEFIYRLPTDE